MPARYHNVIVLLKNAFYAGVYARGKSESQTEIVKDRTRKSCGLRKPLEE